MDRATTSRQDKTILTVTDPKERAKTRRVDGAEKLAITSRCIACVSEGPRPKEATAKRRASPAQQALAEMPGE